MRSCVVPAFLCRYHVPFGSIRAHERMLKGTAIFAGFSGRQSLWRLFSGRRRLFLQLWSGGRRRAESGGSARSAEAHGHGLWTLWWFWGPQTRTISSCASQVSCGAFMHLFIHPFFHHSPLTTFDHAWSPWHWNCFKTFLAALSIVNTEHLLHDPIRCSRCSGSAPFPLLPFPLLFLSPLPTTVPCTLAARLRAPHPPTYWAGGLHCLMLPAFTHQNLIGDGASTLSSLSKHDLVILIKNI